MANLLDYLDTVKKQPIDSTHPLNEIDTLIFARFAYLPFKKINLSDHETISSVAKKLLAVKNARFFLNDRQLISALAKAPRFQNLLVTDYQSEFNPKIDEQFAAICVHLDTGELIISYMGTDDTLSGWKEDCNMAFLDEVPSQKAARAYLKTIAKTYPDKKINIIGHSKGGTLAMTAALTANSKISVRILSVKSLDGPGLSESLVKKARKNPLLNLVRNYIPEHSVAGRLFYHAEKYEVVKSDKEPLFYQHNLYHWQVNLKTKSLVRAACISEESNTNDRIITEWMQKASNKQKRNFIDATFKGIELSSYETPADIMYDGKKAIPNLFGAYLKLDKSERKIVFRGFKKLAKIALLEKRKQRKKTQK